MYYIIFDDSVAIVALSFYLLWYTDTGRSSEEFVNPLDACCIYIV